ncbi:MAG: GNAT family N-acetyltransferase [Acidobacteriota bacterium]
MIVETERLRLRRLTRLDAPFMVGLLNEPAWHRFIGDRGVRTADDAKAYLEKSYLAGYARDGFSMFLVERLADGAALGVCGLMRRDVLDDVDLGFGLKREYRRRGYAREAAEAMLRWGHQTLGLDRIVAITHPDNSASIHLLEKLGFRDEGLVRPYADDEVVRRFGWRAPAPDAPAGGAPLEIDRSAS